MMLQSLKQGRKKNKQSVVEPSFSFRDQILPEILVSVDNEWGNILAVKRKRRKNVLSATNAINFKNI